ncbi:MAG TPA: hypothetical protein VGG75_18000 [Trebonia sp.]
MSGGFEVDLTSLVHAAEGVNGVIADMEYGKVSGIGGPGADYGSGDLSSVMSDFCARWEIGVEHLTTDASEVAGRLTQSAEAYAKAEDKNVSMISGIFQRRSGADPAASSW